MKKSGIAPFNRIQFIATVAVTAAITAGVAWYWSGRDHVRRTIVAAAESQEYRFVQARIHGLPHRPLKTPRGTVSAHSSLPLENAAAEVVRAGDTIGGVDRAHASAVTKLLVTNWDGAAHAMDNALRIETGEENIAVAIRASESVALLTDLAAAHHSLARYRNRPQHYVIAAEAAHHAWSRERTPETAWNRALTIEALSMRDAAIAAWQDYLALDDESPWASEVRDHLAELKAPTAAAQWKDARVLLERAVARGDQKTVAQLVSRFPDHARKDAEDEYLLRWARGGGDEALAICRAIGKALRASTGETLLFDTVAHIDAANEERRAALRRGLRSYGEAHAARDDGYQLDVARRLFQNAFDEFQHAGSPFAEVARMFRWQCVRYENNASVLEATGRWLASAPKSYPALVAQVRWTRGLSFMRAGQPQAAIEEYSRAFELFTRLRETDSVTAMHEMLSEAYEEIGDSEEAWKHRFAALEGFGTSGSSHPTLLETLRLCAVAALKDGFPSVAVLFLDRQLAATKGTADYDTQFFTLLWRSNAHRAHGDPSAAAADLRQARAVAPRIEDPTVKDEAFNQIEMVLDRVSQERDHDARQRILQEAIAYATKKGLSYRLPHLYLRQGIEHRDRDRLDDAERSLFASIDHLEQQRESISEEEQRSTFLAARQDVYRVLASVLCKRRDYGRAFEVIERSRARTLFEQVSQQSGPTPRLLSYRQIQAVLPADTALVVLGEVGGHFGSFVVSRQGVQYGKMLIGKSDLAQRIERFLTALRNDDQKEAVVASQVLHGAVVRPWYPHAQRFRRLIIIADHPLAAIPFAALNDRLTRKFLIESHVISTAPSANVLFAGAGHRPLAGNIAALIVAPSTSSASAGNEMLLRASRAEAMEVARQYASAVVLDGPQATREEFLAQTPKATYIHFAGHAVAENAAIPHLLFASGQRLYAEDIRTLHLPETRLVVLAACDSGSDRTRHTQGISSLARAFLAAGVPTVVASYWDVDDDAASRLSRRLHTFLGRGYEPADALRNAQLQLLTSSDARSRNVSSWAPFVVIGQPTTR